MGSGHLKHFGLVSLAFVWPGLLPHEAFAERPVSVVVVISANAEWRPFRVLWPEAKVETSPYGEWFLLDLEVGDETETVVCFHGGWGKISAAASAQYVIDRWAPKLLVNLGTCGGFAGAVKPGDTLLVDKTVVYDIVEKMGDSDEAIDFYTTHIDLSWLQPPRPGEVKRVPLVSADRDLLPEDIPRLRESYAAVAADWESGAIAWVAARNQTRCLILRTVSDVVGPEGGEAYGNIALFQDRTKGIMAELARALPKWIARSLP